MATLASFIHPSLREDVAIHPVLESGHLERLRFDFCEVFVPAYVLVHDSAVAELGGGFVLAIFVLFFL